LENTYTATGRRKTSIARIILRPGTGQKQVNGQPMQEYLRSETLATIVQQPFVLLEVNNAYDMMASVNGGGLSGQSGAIRLGASRALAKINEEYRKKLRKNGLLTRDPREVERKKYGLAGARKRFQFSKR
jgi:small subunit ribosomal protein S9